VAREGETWRCEGGLTEVLEPLHCLSLLFLLKVPSLYSAEHVCPAPLPSSSGYIHNLNVPVKAEIQSRFLALCVALWTQCGSVQSQITQQQMGCWEILHSQGHLCQREVSLASHECLSTHRTDGREGWFRHSWLPFRTLIPAKWIPIRLVCSLCKMRTV